MRKTFQKGELVALSRSINGKGNRFKYERGTVGKVVQIYHSTSVRVEFEDGKAQPVAAATYLEKYQGND